MIFDVYKNFGDYAELKFIFSYQHRIIDSTSPSFKILLTNSNYYLNVYK